MHQLAAQFVFQILKNPPKTRTELQKLKNIFSAAHTLSVFTNQDIVLAYKMLREQGRVEKNLAFEKLIRKRSIRSLSGVAVVTVLMKPYPCPGKCVFCPTEARMPKSYLSNEPGAMRALLNDFDPYRQVKNRLLALEASGHPTDKVELIVLGGTFSSYPRQYQQDFIRQCLNAMNGGAKERSLEKAQKKNETARHRLVGLSLETRPDFVTEDEIRHFRSLGCTKIQLGVQHLDTDVLVLNKRGHGKEAVILATRICKDAGLKICYHIMPNLPGSTPEKDLAMFRELFTNPDFRPDYLKIYPCSVVPGSELAHWFAQGKYQSYPFPILEKLLVDMKKVVPRYVRIDRLVRDIPGESILEGSRVTNMRQMIAQKYPNLGCQCIRCREIRDEPIVKEKLTFRKLEYIAQKGREVFLEYVQGEKLCALLRLRLLSLRRATKQSHCADHIAIIREVHVFGAHLPLGKREKSASQHFGLGKKLIFEAEKIAQESGFDKIAIISAIGTRPYYRKLSYRLSGTYMVKKLM
ncbi:tRNA uridine(34) 5-carboxymethylaminomethyl modification radical SAM/GNAT enzyme Elp3 [Candidatus Peregrinibacteria bacterium]|nr:tRNA uridine(34) 5-carboxymethylaminomethyl modification radical SAM/GNAT enzyme Elp3 [Candidatus Peregrinibacteria bacterium]